MTPMNHAVSPQGSERLGEVSVLRTCHAEALHHETEAKLRAHFQAMHEILENLGHRPFGKLELRMPSNSADSQVIFRWERRR